MTAPTSVSSARNLFTESKARLSDRIQVNVNSTGSLAKQIVRGSKTNEVILCSCHKIIYFLKSVYFIDEFCFYIPGKYKDYGSLLPFGFSFKINIIEPVYQFLTGGRKLNTITMYLLYGIYMIVIVRLLIFSGS